MRSISRILLVRRMRLSAGVVASLGEGAVPQLQYVIQSYDTAFSKRETADYSAITTWGVFYPKRVVGS